MTGTRQTNRTIATLTARTPKMKHFSRFTTHIASFSHMHRLASFFAAMIFAMDDARLFSQDQVVTTITTSTTLTQNTATTLTAGTLFEYRIADSATLVFRRTADNNAGMFIMAAASANSAFKIGPDAAGESKDGRLVVANLRTTNGPFITMQNAANLVVDMTNALFQDNKATGNGGVIYSLSASSTITLNKSVSTGNSADSGGAVRTNGKLHITSGSFIGNYAISNMGAIGLAAATASNSSFTDVYFESNRTGGYGGAVVIGGASNIAADVSMENIVFKDNWAADRGGAIYSSMAANRTLSIHMTAAGGTNAYLYSGNFTGGVTETGANIESNLPSFAADASKGGFYYAAAGSTLAFNIDENVSLTIGDAAAGNRAHDSLASANATARITKAGAGDLILNADNSGFLGALNISEGRVLLGHADAKFGGDVDVTGGAVGGVGTFAKSVTVRDNAILQIGLDNAAAPGSLAISGSLRLMDAAIIRYDLFSENQSDRLFAATGSATQTTGTAIVDISSFKMGTYNLGNVGAILHDADVSLNGIRFEPGFRLTATLSNVSGDLILITGADISRYLTWTGGASGSWNIYDDDWAGSNSATKIGHGDSVSFLQTADTVITLDHEGIIVSDLVFDGAANYILQGNNNLTTDANSVVSSGSTEVTAARGKLIKQGTGMLTIANIGSNFFKGGIELGGGTIAFANAGQIDTSGATLSVKGDSGLLLNAAIADLPNNMEIDPGKTLIIDTQSYDVTHSGAFLSAGSVEKKGTGKLTLTGNSGGFTGAIMVSEGSFGLEGALLGGGVTLGAGVPFISVGLAAVGGMFDAGPGSVINIAGVNTNVSGTMSVGTLILNGSVLQLDLLSTGNDVINATSLALVNTSTLQIGAFRSGTFTVGEIDGLNTVANLSTGLVVDIGNQGRQMAFLEVGANNRDLLLISTADISRTLTWNGSAGSWTAGAAWNGAVTEYASGDKIIFDNTATAVNRVVDVSGNVYASEIRVSDDGYTFAGSGAIYTGTQYISNSRAAEFASASGKLIKTGAGTLTFANTGGNLFVDGMEIDGGTIQFDNANQLTIGDDAEIVIRGDTRLHATASVTGTLAGNLVIRTGRTVTLDIENGQLGYSGTAIVGNIVKQGAGVVDISPGMLSIDTLSINAGAVKIGGTNINASKIILAADGALQGSGRIIARGDGLINGGVIKVGKAGGADAFGKLMIVGNYTGGGTVELSIGNGALAKDVLDIQGTVSGSTNVKIICEESITTPGNLPGNLITVKDSVAAIEKDTFNIIDSDIIVGASPYPYEYDLMRGQWTQNIKPVPTVPVALGFDVSTIFLGKASLESLSQRMMSTRDVAGQRGRQFWIAGLDRHDKINTTVYDGTAYKTRGFQVGLDSTTNVGNGKLLTYGLFYEYATAEADKLYKVTSSETSVNGFGIYGQANGGSWYVTGVLRGVEVEYDVEMLDKPRFTTTGFGWATSLELGCRLFDLKQWKLEPQAQVVYQNNKINDTTDASGIIFIHDVFESLDARLGMRLLGRFSWKTDRLFYLYMRTYIINEFKGKTRMKAASSFFQDDIGGSGHMADAGVMVQITNGLYFDARAAWYDNDRTDSHTLSLGCVYNW
jgi:outer membrane autotransporter protein